MSESEYSSHVQYMKWVQAEAAEREEVVREALRSAFSAFLEERTVEVIDFSSIDAGELAKAIRAYPVVLKPLLSVCNVAARAIERDLGIKNLNTYEPRLAAEEAERIAGYVKPHLPPVLEIPSLCRLDRVWFVDKEIRARKGQWEKRILQSLNAFARVDFRKRSFRSGGERFEIDAASPTEGDIALAVDVKRIEARRDIHKRSDEIVNKAAKLKQTSPEAMFGAIVYYPFVAEHANVQSRLESPNIDCVFFAADTDESIEQAARMLLARFGVER